MCRCTYEVTELNYSGGVNFGILFHSDYIKKKKILIKNLIYQCIIYISIIQNKKKKCNMIRLKINIM